MRSGRETCREAQARDDEDRRDLGPQLRRGAPEHAAASRLPTGIAEVDDLLAGGFPRGRLSEIAGPLSSGRKPGYFADLARIPNLKELGLHFSGD